jgi:hypothetical protein
LRRSEITGQNRHRRGGDVRETGSRGTGSGLAIIHIIRRGYLWGEMGTFVPNVLEKFLKVGTRIQSEFACNPSKKGKS